jgi:predicted TIM-barrel fold metal-dependent hydrolase
MHQKVFRKVRVAASALFIGTLLLAFAASHTSTQKTSVSAHESGAEMRGFSAQELSQFIVLEPIDTHTHIYESEPSYFAMLNKLHLHTLDIMVVADNANPERRELAKESRDVFEVVKNSDNRVASCTTFDAYRVNQINFIAATVRQLNQDFAQGAIAVKIWKNVGMEIKNTRGEYILPDDPSLEPIYADIAAHGKTLVTHMADPDTAWLPPDPTSPDYSYFVEHPEWYMYKNHYSPSKPQILVARDHVLQANPNLRMVGAHLGSMEGNFAQIAQRLDRYPNFAVDLAGRLPYLMLRPRDQMIAFITKYQDRLIYGTDDALYPSEEVRRSVAEAEVEYANDWRFLATNQIRDLRGRTIEGLALPPSILHKIYHENAVHWFPGILGNRQ